MRKKWTILCIHGCKIYVVLFGFWKFRFQTSPGLRPWSRCVTDALNFAPNLCLLATLLEPLVFLMDGKFDEKNDSGHGQMTLYNENRKKCML